MAAKQAVPEVPTLFSSHQEIIPLDVIRARHFTIAGCGALGTILARILARLGTHRFHLIDGDKVEERHLNREVFGHDQVGSNKAAALSYQLGRIHSKVRCVTTGKKLSKDDLLPGREDHLILAADDPDLALAVFDWVRDWAPEERPTLWVTYLAGLRGGYGFFDLKQEVPSALPEDLEDLRQALHASKGAKEGAPRADRIATTAYVVSGLLAQAIADRLMTRPIRDVVTIDLGATVRSDEA